MKKPTDFAYYLSKFFSVYLTDCRNLSRNTISSYSHTFRLLIQFYEEVQSVRVNKLSMKHLTKQSICAFLNWLQEKRSCSDSTRNSRLAAIHSFCNYLQSEAPEHAHTCQTILSIPHRKKDIPMISYLSKEQVSRLLHEPNLEIDKERRDAVLLSVLYDTGARVQELCDLKVRNISLNSTGHITLKGKGRKTRVVPITSSTKKLLSNYIKENNMNVPEKADHPLFFNQRGDHLSRGGVTHILKKYAIRTKDMTLPSKISPHLLRHSKAMHLQQAGYNMIVIRDLLGHVSVKTTEIYARLDIDAKRAILEEAFGGFPLNDNTEYPDWTKDQTLMDYLRSL